MSMVGSSKQKKSLINRSIILEYVEELNPSVCPGERYFRPLPNTNLALPVDQTTRSTLFSAGSTHAGMSENKNSVETVSRRKRQPCEGGSQTRKDEISQ